MAGAAARQQHRQATTAAGSPNWPPGKPALSWPQAPIPAKEPWKDPPNQPNPDGGPVKGSLSLRTLLGQAAADMRNGLGADGVFHQIQTRLDEIAPLLPHAIAASTGDLAHMLRALNARI